MSNMMEYWQMVQEQMKSRQDKGPPMTDAEVLAFILEKKADVTFQGDRHNTVNKGWWRVDLGTRSVDSDGSLEVVQLIWERTDLRDAVKAARDNSPRKGRHSNDV